MSNKKAQVSEIMSWVVATLAILTILLVFIYVSSIYAQKTKIIEVKNLDIDLKETINLLKTKNSIAYDLASEINKQIIENWENENE